ncbi:MAG TPA: acyl-CoA reductase [Verrucomicrobiae bacterium]|nr:acyl-CoA reductase [Verrucomicrobiae bacterium]
MNLPNYFLADLPPEATLTPQMLAEACATLKRNREQYLTSRSTASLVNLIAEVADNWGNEAYPFRKLALEHGPKATGFSRGTLTVGLDGFFQQLTVENLNALITQDLGHLKRLNEFTATSAEERASRAAFVFGPEFLVHIAAGNIPNPTLMSVVLGLLVRSAQFVKCASGTSFLPRLFAHSIYDTDRKLGACLELAEWRGGTELLEQTLFGEADCVTVTGSDETLRAIREKLPARARLLGYGHRVSFGFVAGGALRFGVKKVVQRAATDVVAWDQLGCLSPHVIYVEHGGGISAEQFAELLAEELAAREVTEPRGVLAVETAATIASRRAFYEVRAAHSPDTRMWHSGDSTAWTVIYEADPKFQASCLHRFVYVKGTPDLANALRGADDLRGQVSTVGLAAAEDKVEAMVKELARWGVTRVCPLGQMQNPPLTWRHDGRPALSDLVTWVDWEQK